MGSIRTGNATKPSPLVTANRPVASASTPPPISKPLSGGLLGAMAKDKEPVVISRKRPSIGTLKRMSGEYQSFLEEPSQEELSEGEGKPPEYTPPPSKPRGGLLGAIQADKSPPADKRTLASFSAPPTVVPPKAGLLGAMFKDTTSPPTPSPPLAANHLVSVSAPPPLASKPGMLSAMVKDSAPSGLPPYAAVPPCVALPGAKPGMLGAMVADTLKPEPQGPVARPGMLGAMVADASPPPPAMHSIAALEPLKPERLGPKIGMLGAIVADMEEKVEKEKKREEGEVSEGIKESTRKAVGLLGAIYKDVTLKQHYGETTLKIDRSKRKDDNNTWTDEDEARMLYHCALVIQKKYRQWPRKEFFRLKKLRRRILFIQCGIRRFIAMRERRRVLRVVINCQRAYRCLNLRKRWPRYDEVSRSIALLKVKRDKDESLAFEQKTFGDMMEEIRYNDQTFGTSFFPNFVPLPLTFTNILGKTNTREFFPSGLMASLHKVRHNESRKTRPVIMSSSNSSPRSDRRSFREHSTTRACQTE